jgi:hypothetical protein
VNRIIAVLVFFGVVLLGLAAWFWWATKPVPRHLDALDAMSSRSWRDAGPAERSAMLAPVHERRGELREDDLIVASEPVEEAVPAVASVEVAAASPVDVGEEEAAVSATTGAVLTDSRAESPTDSLGESLADSRPESLTDSLPESLTDSRPESLTDSRPESLTDSLGDHAAPEDADAPSEPAPRA